MFSPRIRTNPIPQKLELMTLIYMKIIRSLLPKRYVKLSMTFDLFVQDNLQRAVIQGH